jgi:hypothetical protein
MLACLDEATIRLGKAFVFALRAPPEMPEYVEDLGCGVYTRRQVRKTIAKREVRSTGCVKTGIPPSL